VSGKKSSDVHVHFYPRIFQSVTTAVLLNSRSEHRIAACTIRHMLVLDAMMANTCPS
jgi:hypothetical protein